MVARKIGWYVLLFGVILGIADYFGLMDYLTGNPTGTLSLSSWVLTPIFWAAVALIVVGVIIVRLGREKYPMPKYR